MNHLLSLLIAATLTAQLQALDTKDLAAVAQGFTAESGEQQFQARMELDRLVNEATTPGKDRAAATRTLVAALQSNQTPAEAKKYILRNLAKVGTAEAIAPAGGLLKGPDAILREEARQVLESIPDPSAIAILEQALRTTKDKRETLSLVNSLAMQKASQSVPAIQQLVVDPDLEVARAAVTALAKIGGKDATTSLGKAYTSSKVAPPLKADVEKALLVAGLEDTAIMLQIYQSTASDSVRLAAFQLVSAGELTDAKAAAIEAALKSDHELLRQAALRRGLEENLPSLQKGLAQTMGQLPIGDRLVVLSAIHLVKPAATAEKIALSSATSDEEDERVAALAALGLIATQPAFDTVLQAVGAREPRINQAAGSAIATMNYPAAAATLLEMLKGNSTENRILAIKAVAYRQVPGANAPLLSIIGGADQNATREAVKVLYFTATLEDLRTLCATAKSTDNANLRKMLTSICTKIAGRINTDEARALVQPLK